MSVRIGWFELPPQVRAGIENILGEAVTEASSQPGGFSPGSADRVLLASGRRAFVKAVSADSNEAAATLHRREAAVTASLPAAVPAPQLLGTYDDGTWVALVLTDIAGRHPQEPWQEEELAEVLTTLAQLARVPLPAGLLPRYEEELGPEFTGWDLLLAWHNAGGDMTAHLDQWTLNHVGDLSRLARKGVQFLAGTGLVHGDLRCDNILLADGRAVLLDWPWAAVGASWTDALSILINVKTLDADSREDSEPGVDMDKWLAHEAFAGVSDQAINGFLAGMAGYFMNMSRHPAPPNIPTLRAFQRKQGQAVLSWLAARLS